MTAPSYGLGTEYWQIRLKGLPVPQGSMRSVLIKDRRGFKRTGLVHQSSQRLGIWRAGIAWKARESIGSSRSVFLVEPDLPVYMQMSFSVFQRSSSRKKTLRPDLDKLIRAVLDACTGIIYADDSQVTEIIASKMLVRKASETGLSLLWRKA